MWRLSPDSYAGAKTGQTYHLLVGVEYVVGRKNCAILIQEDSSISRSHAVLSVCHPEANLSQSFVFPVLTLKDTSKYGTFVNGEQIPNGTVRTLNSGDTVRFGVFKSKYKVEYEPLIVCSSCLDTSQKNALNKNILQLGGHAVNEWKEKCTHLVMVSVKITVKAICALICGQPIVKPEYFTELIKAVQVKQELPKPASFCPEIDEPSINHENVDLSACPQRKTIFKEKLFVFLTSKQYAKLNPAIKLGGGETKLVNEDTVDAASLVSPNICVVEVGVTNSQASSDQEMKWIDTVSAVLQRNKYRTISEAEISLAVIFASTEKYCNPQNQLNMGVQSSPSISVVPEASLSQCAVVDETVRATIAGNITAYVPDTKMDELMDTCMEITDQEKNEETVTKKRKAHPDSIISIKETPAGSGIVNKRATLSSWNRKSENEESLSFSPSKTPGHSRNRERHSQPQSNSIKNYFQTACKKRERSEDGETSQSKHAKIELPQACSQTQPVASPLWNSNVEESEKWPCTLDQKTSEMSAGSSRKSVEERSKLEKTVGEDSLAGKSASKRKRELYDVVEDEKSLELVFASHELDWENNKGYEGESASSTKKKQKLEAEQGHSGNEETRKVLLENKHSLSALNQKQEIKEQPDSPRNDMNKKEPGELGSNCSHLPSRLLLTEFRSLVVSQPRSSSCTKKTNYSHLNDFKKFKKVAYPGEGQLPRIIGGSDLIAHHARKNAEMEEWLQQEMEEQNRYAKEESLAEDLFRYNPHTKRR